MSGSEISQAKLRALEELLGGSFTRSGEAFALAREDNPGKWTKKLLRQHDAEKRRASRKRRP